MQHTFGLSDERVVEEWPARPYRQDFCVEEFFQHEQPVDFSQISGWRKRSGKEGEERILKLTVEAGGGRSPSRLSKCKCSWWIGWCSRRR